MGRAAVATAVEHHIILQLSCSATCKTNLRDADHGPKWCVMTPSLGNLALYGLVLVLPLAILLQQRLATTDPESAPEPASDPEPIRPKENKEKGDNTGATIMQSERTDLAPPKDDPFTQEELRAFDGQDPAKPVYVAIKGTSKPTLSPPPTPPPFSLSLHATPFRVLKFGYTRAGTVFDVSRKRDTYGPGGSYALFAGKDASRALGLSSLKPEDAVPDWSTLEEKDRKTLDEWHAFFSCVLLTWGGFFFSCFGVDFVSFVSQETV